MRERPALREFLAGVLAAVVMTAAMAILRVTSDIVSLPELLGAGVVNVMPAELFSRLLDLLLKAARPLLLATLLVGQLALGGLFGRLYGRKPDWDTAFSIALVTWLVVGLALFPLLGLGVFGGALRANPAMVAVTLFAVFLVFAAALELFHSLLLPARAAAAGSGLTRRTALARLGGAVAAVTIGGCAWRALSAGAVVSRAAAPGGGTPSDPAFVPPPAATAGGVSGFSPAPGEPAAGIFAVPGLSPEVTPSGSFYTVSKNFFDPAVDAARWSLTVDGLVERPVTYDYSAITQLPAISSFYTLQCISNPVGGDLWGNAYWRGVRLADLLNAARPRPGVRKVVFHAADDYTDSITLDRALNPEAILAYEMNGAPLDKSHGFPARLLIPNIYGMKNVKWVTRIELVDHDFKGYWMQRGWDDAAPYKVSSRIDVPAQRDSLAIGAVPIAGVTFAGERGIGLVEYSLDDGKTWQPAELKPRLATNTWQLWTAQPNLRPGKYVVKVRATDGAGTLQDPKDQDSLPAGATGYHTVIVTVG